jgi:serine/threonine protein kinase
MKIPLVDWERLSRLLDEALDLDPKKREPWINSLGPEHDDVRGVLREILLERSGVETSDFLQRIPQFSAVPQGIAVRTDDLVGPYRLLRELGSGGTADVWLAERADGVLKRKVAIKLPHLGLIDRGLGARMARERDILAGLEHPNIARLYDAGIDHKGRPYLALEYVDGIPPDQYCEKHALPIRQRLELFLHIARTVAYAHAHLIVHRDLKPNNILVTNDGSVRLLDFGIARLLQGNPTASSHQTQIGAHALTPAYAAPEQFTNQPVTVATDVYSLAVILFELVTGHTPYSPKRNTPAALEEAVLRDEPRLASSVALSREARELRGDIDTILAKALKKSPHERYASVEAFAADIERHLAGLPIAARAPSFWYVTKKFSRRNALPLGVAVLVTLALATSLGVAAWQWTRAEQQRLIAVDRLANSVASTDFMSAILMERLQPGESVTFEELIARSEQMAHESGENDLRTRIFATDFLANWYMANGLAAKAEKLLTQTIASLPENEPRLGSLLECRRAIAWQQLGREVAAREALTTQIARTSDDPATRAQCLLLRAYFALSMYDAAGALRFAQGAQRQSELAGTESVYDTASILETMGSAYALAHRSDLAQSYFRRALGVFEQSGRGRTRAAAAVHQSWAASSLNTGSPALALEHIDTAIAINKELAPNVQESAITLSNRARSLVQLGRFAEANAQFEEAARLAASREEAISQAAIAVGQSDIAIALGELDRAQGHLADAELALRSPDLPAGQSVGARHLLAQAALSAARGNLESAAALSSSAINAYEKLDCCYGPRALAFALRAQISVKRHQLTAAQAEASRAVDEAKTAQAKEPYSFYTANALRALGMVREAQGLRREASAAYHLAAEHFANTLGPASPDALQVKKKQLPE